MLIDKEYLEELVKQAGIPLEEAMAISDSAVPLSLELDRKSKDIQHRIHSAITLVKTVEKHLPEIHQRMVETSVFNFKTQDILPPLPLRVNLESINRDFGNLDELILAGAVLKLAMILGVPLVFD